MKTLRTATTLLLLIALAALAGCSGDDGPTGPTITNSASTVDGGLELTAGTDKASYAFGEDVVVTVTLKNTSSSTIALDYARGNPARYPNLSVNIRNDGLSHMVEGDGSDDKTTLGAGRSVTYSWVWDQVSRLSRQPVDRGVYEVIGFVDFDDRDTIRVDKLFIELK